VGSALLAEIFEWGIGQGLREYDFLEGDAWYKRRWSTAQRTAVDLVFGGEPAGYVFEARAAAEGSG
jgi:CelD/BcsL family acetyltransferase involved in cellulose biosynthesis